MINGSKTLEVRFVCLLCGSEQSEKFMNLGNFDILQCRSCGLGQTYPFPSEQQQLAVNQNVYTIENRLQAYNSRFKEFSQRYERQLVEIEKYRLTSTKTLLDIGCSLGFFLAAAKKKGYDTYGVELSKETSDYAQNQQNLKVFWGLLQDAQYDDNQFDVITMWDVLEHVPEPRSMLQEIHRVLQHKGLLVIQSPNMDSLMADISKEYWLWWIVPDHLYHFSPDSLANLLSSCGFTVSTVCTWEPSIDFLFNWFMAKLHLKNDNITFRGRLLKRIVLRLSKMLWPIVVPIQRAAWRQNRGALVTIYAYKPD